MKKFLKLEVSRQVNRRNIILMAVFMFLALVIHQVAIEKYERDLRTKSEFIDLEILKVESYKNYHQYAEYGLKMIMVPSQISSIFNQSSTLLNIQTIIESKTKLDLNKPEFGLNLFDKPTGGNLDLSWFVLVIGSLLALAWGLDTFRNTQYLKLCLNFCTPRAVYCGVILARVILLTVFMLILGVLACGQFYVNGIDLTKNDLLSICYFLLIGLIMMVFFLVLGSLFGIAGSKSWRFVIPVLLWFSLVILWPELLTLVFPGKGYNKMDSVYQHEREKLNILIKFENTASKYVLAEYKKSREEGVRADKEMSERYWNQEYPKICALDAGAIGDTRKMAENFHLLSIFNPSTFYKSVNNELSSKGYNGYTAFYDNDMKIHKGFLRYYIDKKYQPLTGKVEPYLKGEEYVFYAKSSLPAYFIQGIALNVFYILIFLAFSYYRFKKSLFFSPVKSGTFDQVNLDFKPGNHYHLGIDQKDFSYRLYGVLSGKEGPGHITIDKEKITGKCKLVYLPGLSHIPGDIRVKALISLACASFNLSEDQEKELLDKLSAQDIGGRYFKDLSLSKQAVFLLMLTGYRKPDVYFFDEFFFKLPHETIIEILDNVLDKFKQSGSLIIEVNELQSNFHVEHSRFDQVFMVGFDGISYTVMPV